MDNEKKIKETDLKIEKNNFESDDPEEDWDGSDDTASWEELLAMSQHALSIYYNFGTETEELKELKYTMSSVDELVEYLNEMNFSANKVEKQLVNIEVDDTVIAAGRPYIVLEIKNGFITLETLNKVSTVPLKYFEQLYDGCVITIDNASKRRSPTVLEKDIIGLYNKNVVNQDPLLPVVIGESVPIETIKKWNGMHKDPQIIAWAKQITAGVKDPIEKCKKIFLFVQKKIKYHYHNNSLHSPIETYKKRVGNCCEKSRLLVVLTRAVVPEIQVQYQHSKHGKIVKSGKTAGHVWNGHYIKGKWLASDTTFSICKFGEGNSKAYKHDKDDFYTYTNLMF